MFYYYLTKLNCYRAASDGTVNVQKVIELQRKRQTREQYKTTNILTLAASSLKFGN